MGVARGGRVDEAEEPLRPDRGIAPRRLAVLGADIDGGVRRKTAAAKNVGELGRVVGGEEDVVPAQGKSLGLCLKRPGHG